MTMRLAFVGIDHPHGAGWRQLLQNFGDQLEMVAAVPGLAGATSSWEERYAELPQFGDLDQLLSWDQFDAAVVCLPNDSGPAAATKLAAAGKHLLVEKPMAARSTDLDALAAAVQQNQVAFQSGYMWRYDQCANRLRRMIRQGQFGKLISVEMTFATSDVQRRGSSHYLFDPSVSQGGFFNWLACHYLDLLGYVCDQHVRSVLAHVGVFGDTPTEVEDGGAVIMELEQGTLATFVGGYWIPRWAGEAYWTLRGSQRWVHWDPSRPGTAGALDIHGPKPQWHAMEEQFCLPADTTPGYGGCNGLALVQDWLDAAQAATASRPACRNTVASGQQTLRLIEAIGQASSQRRAVSLSELCGSGDDSH